MKPPAVRGWRGAIVVVSLALAACSPTPSGSPPPSASPAPTEAAVAPGLILGCIGIEAGECQFVAEQVVAQLPAARGPAFAVEIQLYGCPNAGACPQTLAVREGKATIEYADRGEPIEFSVAGPPQAPRLAPLQGFWLGLTQPASPRVAGQGPFPYDVGHCGITHLVDFDGSFWIPVGQVDGDASGLINSESGQMRLVGPNLAQYQGPGGFTVGLARFPGPKHFWGCD